MTKEEFLIEKHNNFMDGYTKGKTKFYTNPSVSRIEPFKIADGLYYVGDKEVCVHLIDTGDGLILIDSGFFGATHILVDSIWRAGFDPKNVRWIIHTHGHFDHFGSSEEFRIMYGTKLAISRVDAEALRLNSHRAYIDDKIFPFAKIPVFDYEIEDGEIFELGNVKIRCVLTPGHTTGVLSLFFNVSYNGNTYLAGMHGGAGLNTIDLAGICFNGYSDDCPYQMLDSIEKLWNEPVDIQLGNHPWNNHTLEKREQQLKEGGNPFIAPDEWQKFLGGLKICIEDVIKSNKKLNEELNELYGK